MNSKNLVLLLLYGILLPSCAILKGPEISKNADVSSYRFVVVPNTPSLSASSGGVYGNQYGVYGSSSTKEINPSNIIEGLLLKKGLVSTKAVMPENKDETLLVRYGESGRRNVAGGLGGYTLEVTIIILSASNHEIVYSCTAEGQGSTEVDDIREAIHRCLSGL